VNQFVDMHDIGDTLVHAGFADPVMDMEILTVTFDSLSAIVSDLKTLGVNNKLNGRSRGLFSPTKWKLAEKNYESFRKDGKLPVTIEVIYGHAWKPKPKKLSDGKQVIEFRNLSK
jgi:malonyl-CoA O-methyltransferase